MGCINGLYIPHHCTQYPVDELVRISFSKIIEILETYGLNLVLFAYSARELTMRIIQLVLDKMKCETFFSVQESKMNTLRRTLSKLENEHENW